MKYLLWALLLYLAWRWYSALKHKSEAAGPEATSSPVPDAGREAAAEAMVRCASCGIHLPVSEALPAPGDLHYCSEAHRTHHQAH